MFTLFSTGSSKSVEYWEGWQAFGLHKQCTYSDPKQRKDWAKGFADAVNEDRGSKVWYKSKTLIVGIALLVVGTALIIYGSFVGKEHMIIGFGSGITVSSIMMTALRLITSTGVTIGAPGATGQYTLPPAP